MLNIYLKVVYEQKMMQKNDFTLASPEDIERALGERLAKLRLARNINQTTLAAEAGVSRRTISNLENGEGVSFDTLIRVMRALGVIERLADLLPDPDVRPIERVRMQGRERKRARMPRVAEADPWQWGDEAREE